MRLQVIKQSIYCKSSFFIAAEWLISKRVIYALFVIYMFSLDPVACPEKARERYIHVSEETPLKPTDRGAKARLCRDTAASVYKWHQRQPSRSPLKTLPPAGSERDVQPLHTGGLSFWIQLCISREFPPSCCDISFSLNLNNLAHGCGSQMTRLERGTLNLRVIASTHCVWKKGLSNGSNREHKWSFLVCCRNCHTQ